ncbi:hypothetical protein HNO88_000132 [Novosphingobium chloroacetimidivorans]|uniref:Uncharacterized protein n=1 Tax=Novosphingobium chloroacetimidivorans TaxID=1428314 RepID=A0A7W7NV72_9SPHN|nr:hypothetical protein [Novosphingobium chloroacetimidivorans]MBB4856835.1 hypothetical protein [Novosphingobium chloroacetimidivorans]
MSRSFLIFSLLCSAVLLVAAQSAFARPDPRMGAVSRFDLAQTLRSHPDQRRFRLGQSDRTPRFRDEKIKPHWVYSPVEGGPAVEVGALGGGRKGTPKLAHVRVGWNF